MKLLSLTTEEKVELIIVALSRKIKTSHLYKFIIKYTTVLIFVYPQHFYDEGGLKTVKIKPVYICFRDKNYLLFFSI